LFLRLLVAGLIMLAGAVALGLFFGQHEHGNVWVLFEVTLASLGCAIFVVASSDSFNLTHHQTITIGWPKPGVIGRGHSW
jgi:hypothetical protein